MQRLVVTLSLIFGLATTSSIQAMPRENAQWEQQRELFSQAESAVKRRQIKTYQRLLADLEGYPLLPYLELLRVRQVGYLANEQRVLDFLNEVEHTPLDWRARQPWLDYLIKQQEYERFLRDFRGPGTTKHQCFKVYAELVSSELPSDQVLAQVDDIWRTGKSLPKACDAVLEAWSNAGLRTTDKVWERIVLAAEGGTHTLLPYLTTLLPESMQYLAKVYHQVRRNPSTVAKLDTLQREYLPHEASIITYGLSRLIWRDPDLALATYDKVAKQWPFTIAQQLKLKQSFAIALSVKNHSDAQLWLAKLGPAEHTDATLQWQLADWVRRGAWPKIIAFVPKLTAENQARDQWQYWLARALETMEHTSVAAPMWERLAESRSYYGFLAAARLGQPVRLQQQPIELSAEQREQLWALPGVQRAYELLQLDRRLDARREWNELLQQRPATEHKALAAIAGEWGWHDQAIFTLGQIGEFDAVIERFPEAYIDDHKRFSQAAKIDVNWALAVSRRESAFRHDARSHAGAYGIMQLLPSTARMIERSSVSKRDLLHVPTNISLGTRYLADLQRRLGDNWLLATAAYNAGIYRVYDWLPEQPLEADRWVETIPYAETRDYVKNVLAYQQIYHAIRDNNTSPKVFATLPLMLISRTQYTR